MIEMKVETLIFTSPPSPCALILQPKYEKPVQNETYNSIRILPIWIGMVEASQLAVSLEKTKFERPMTHDLFLDVLTNFDSCVDHVLIHNVKGSTFFTKLTLAYCGRFIEIDARPSDAISLALRQDAPIYINEWVLAQESYPYLRRGKQATEEEINKFNDFIKMITPQDFTS